MLRFSGVAVITAGRAVLLNLSAVSVRRCKLVLWFLNAGTCCTAAGRGHCCVFPDHCTAAFVDAGGS